MSIHNSIDYGNYVVYDREPEWMRSERYEYCEPFSLKSENKGLIARLVSLFK